MDGCTGWPAGRLARLVPDRRRRPGTGEQVRGTVVVDLTRQRVTLVLSDDLPSVTAIAIPG